MKPCYFIMLTPGLSCVDSILVNGVGAVYCPTMEMLDAETNPGVRESAFGPDDHVSDKG